MVRLQNPEGLFCTVQAGSIRLINEGSITVDVCPKRTEHDPYHALIKNVPVRLEESAVANRLAQRIAEISSLYDPPG